MPEIGNYGPINASVPLNKRINPSENNTLNKQRMIDSSKSLEPRKDNQPPNGQNLNSARKREDLGFTDTRQSGQFQTPLSTKDIESRAALKETGFLGLTNVDEPSGAVRGESFASLGEPGGIDAFQRATEQIRPKRFQLEDKTVENRVAERLDQSIETLNKRMEELGRSVRFSKDREFDREVITVVNPDSGDIVRQIPTEYAIRISEGLKSLRGLLFDDKA